MNAFKSFFSHKRTIVWASVTTFLVVFALVVSLLIMNVFATVFNFAFGGPQAIYAEGVVSMYPATLSYSKAEAFENANAMNVRLEEEGAILLKNGADPDSTEDDVLPLASGARVSVFGKNSVNLSYGNSGSSGGDLTGAIGLHEGLERAGFTVNPTLKEFYEDDSRSGAKRAPNSDDLDSGGNQLIATAETPVSKYGDVRNSFADYSDAAIVVITRIGGEGFDLPRVMTGMEGANSDTDHYLQLDKNETEMLDMVCEEFDKVIVLLNIPATMEAGFLTDPDYYAYNANIDAAMYIGFPGKQGTLAIGNLLAGKATPSGHTVDVWAKNFKNDPTFVNFGDNNITDGDKYTAGMYYFVEYEESIYSGYRYYETRAASYDGPVTALNEETYDSGEEWYADNVVFPFGYGLSYTNFTWTVTDASEIEDQTIAKGEKYSVTVNVHNDGDVAGSDVVQLYAHAPYTEGGVEKAEVVLVGYAKTPVIQPGGDEEVTIEFDPYYLASYDYSGANANDHKGYELEAGAYTLYVAEDSHDRSRAIPFNSPEIIYDIDPVSENPVVNRYTDNEDKWMDSDAQLGTLLTRSDWNGTWPTSPTDETRNAPADLIAAITDESTNNPYADEMDTWEMPWFDEDVTMRFRDFLPATAPETPTYKAIVSYGDERWDTFLDQCNADLLARLLNEGGYQTIAMEEVGVPWTYEYDGPTGYVNFGNEGAVYDVAYYPCEPIVAATWNAELVEEFGVVMGEEGIWGNMENAGMPYTGIWAPGVNLHRSPFGGRNAEYFSEDPFLSGKTAAAEIRGLQSRGVFAGIKHFAANEQETHRSRNGDLSWLSEQTLRELCLRPFEIAVKEAEARALMSSFNRIGTRWTGGDYRLLTEILRDEWGFRGLVVCDFNTNAYMNSRQMAYAGGDLNLATTPVSWCDVTDTSDTIILRQNAKNILYALVNSNAMNGDVIGYNPATWQVLVVVIDCVLAVLLIAWSVIEVIYALRHRPGKDAPKDGADAEAK